jgi:CheY-like chemotaxis protein
MPRSRILVIDDEAAIRDSLRMTLEYEGYEFVGAATGQEGIALAERDTPTWSSSTSRCRAWTASRCSIGSGR